LDGQALAAVERVLRSSIASAVPRLRHLAGPARGASSLAVLNLQRARLGAMTATRRIRDAADSVGHAANLAAWTIPFVGLWFVVPLCRVQYGLEQIATWVERWSRA
jgi:hypothetical protein